MTTLSHNALKAVSLCDVKQLRKADVLEVAYIGSEIDYDKFFSKFLLPNRPCVFGPHITRGWKGIQEWVKEDGRPDFDLLTQKFGHAVVPVADCKRVEYSAQPKSDMQLSHYLQYWQRLSQDGGSADSSCLYLKDWHFNKFFPDYEAYQTPIFFTSDWMNEYWDNGPDPTSDDYRFVYMGPKGSWTPFHADVFRSYSWSANVCGRKRWLLYPPGQEANLQDTLGNLVYDVTCPEMSDQIKYPDYSKACKPFEVIQAPGEVIFVPSGWHHQVFNIEDTISINHNWLNGCNVDITWAFLQQELALVKKSISDCQDMEGWDVQCQIIMKANTGIDYPEFLQLLWTVAAPRLHKLKLYKESSGKCCCSGLDGPAETDDFTRSGVELRDRRTVVKPYNSGRTVQTTRVKEMARPSNDESTKETVGGEGYPLSSQNAPGLRMLLSNNEPTAPCLTINTCVICAGFVKENQPSPQCTKDDDDEKQGCIVGSTHNALHSLSPSDAGQLLAWHLIFDLCRIRDVLTLLLEDEDFCQIEQARLCKDPQEFIKEISNATKDLV